MSQGSRYINQILANLNQLKIWFSIIQVNQEDERHFKMKYNEMILENQMEYIKYFFSSVYGRIYGGKIKKICNIKDINSISQGETEYIIRLINSCRVLRFVQSTKQKIVVRRYLASNLSVLNNVKKIQKHFKRKNELTVACIIKNESPYIKEWIDFHILVGVDKFIIFDNESDDNIKDILNPYIDAGYVEYIFFPGKQVQMIAYNIACSICKKISKWLAFIDADEFLLSVNGSNLIETLQSYEKYPGVGVNWVVYGHSDHEEQPKGMVMENYKLTFQDKNNELNCRIKSIVNPKMVRAVMSPHHCWYKGKAFAVDEKENPIYGAAIYAKQSSMSCTFTNNTNILRINHYWTKSKQELRRKCKRGYPDGHKNPVYDIIIERLNYPMKQDYCIEQFVKKIKESNNGNEW